MKLENNLSRFVKLNALLDFYKGEFIGESIEVLDSSNKYLIGISGQVIFESRNFFEIESLGIIKKVFKETSVFLISGVKIFGNVILKRPYERLKLGPSKFFESKIYGDVL